MTPNPRRALAAATLAAGAARRRHAAGHRRHRLRRRPVLPGVPGLDVRRHRRASTSSTATSPSPATASCASSTTRWSATSTPASQVEDGLIVNRVNGQDDKWSASQVAQPDLLRQHQVRQRLLAHGHRDGERRRPVGGGVLEGQLRLRPGAGRELQHPQQQRAVLGGAGEHRPSTSPARSSRAARSARATSSSTTRSGPRARGRRPTSGPRARPHARLPPRAHPSRVGHLLRGQQLAPADAVRLGVDHALPAVQRVLVRPEHDRPPTATGVRPSTAPEPALSTAALTAPPRSEGRCGPRTIRAAAPAYRRLRRPWLSPSASSVSPTRASPPSSTP